MTDFKTMAERFRKLAFASLAEDFEGYEGITSVTVVKDDPQNPIQPLLMGRNRRETLEDLGITGEYFHKVARQRAREGSSEYQRWVESVETYTGLGNKIAVIYRDCAQGKMAHQDACTKINNTLQGASEQDKNDLARNTAYKIFLKLNG